MANVSDVPGPMLEALSESELHRASRLLDDGARARWAASRALLRDLLGRFAGADPASLQFDVGPYGKPRLRRSSTEAPMFNMSHSGEIAVYAFSWDHDVGVDVEALDRDRSGRRDEVAIASRFLGAELAGRLAVLDPESRTREFLAAWVAHEAVAKCSGLGLGGAKEGGTTGVGNDLCVRPLEVGDRAVAAVAVQAEGIDVDLRRWRMPPAPDADPQAR